MNYSGLKTVVTGGLGFIGSNLAIRLVQLGAEVTIIDSLLDGCGGNVYNIAPVQDSVRLIEADISDTRLLRDDLRKADVIFNLAGEISHIHSMQFPERDLQVNTVAQLRFVLACQQDAPQARIVYAGTRQVYGVPEYLPVDENHPVNPVDYNGVHKYAATQYHLMLTRAGLLDAAVVRLTNVYGPRMALDVVCQGFFSTFVRRMVLKQTLEIFGDGTQVRDPLFVDDAVDAFLSLGRAQNLKYRTFNAGGPETHSLKSIATIASRVAGCPDPIFRPFPADRKTIDIGSYHTDDRRARAELGWTPRTGLEEGLRRTLDYYQAELPHYLLHGQTDPPCRMPEHSGSKRRLQYMQATD
jgi:UDP-glucose 4-epimerase